MKPPGKGQVYCAPCAIVARETPRPWAGFKHLPNACVLCGGPKDRGRGRSTCDPCRPLLRGLMMERKHPPVTERRCRRCRLTKPVSDYDLIIVEVRTPKASPHYKVCRECRQPSLPKPCVVCGVPKQAGRGRLYCASCAADPDAKPPEDRVFGSVSKAARERCWELSEGICGICSQEVDPTSWEVDHIRPQARGGTHEQENLQVAHRTCNIWKNDRWEEPNAN